MNRRQFLTATLVTVAATALGPLVDAFPVRRPSSLDDLVKQTLEELGEARFGEIAGCLQYHEAMRRLLRQRELEYWTMLGEVTG